MRDVRFALRSLRATPVVSLAAIVSLALGIGANTALLSLVDRLTLRALPVNDPTRLALVTDVARGSASLWTNPIWEQIRDRPELFDGAAAYSPNRFEMATDGRAEIVDGVWASGRFFQMLGVRAAAGHLLAPVDDRRGDAAERVVVISYALWQRRFAGAADVVGRTLVLEGVPFKIAGVSARGFFGAEVGRAADVAVPLGAEPLIRRAESLLDRRDVSWLTVMVRLRSGQSLEQGAASLRGVQPQIREASVTPGPRALLREPFALESASHGTSPLRRRYGHPLVTITIVATLVLLVACANIANLMLARATSSQRARIVKTALGASRWRLARELFIESAVIASLGTLVGVAFANWSSRLLVTQLATQTGAPFVDLDPDWRTFAFTSALAMIITLLFGTAPALLASRSGSADALKAGRGTTGRRLRLADGIVVAQIALSMVLIVGAGLFGRTFARLTTMNLGFDRHGVLLATINMQPAGIPPAGRLPLLDRVRASAGAVTGVSDAAVAALAPLSGGYATIDVLVDDAEPLPDGQRGTAVNYVSPGWFSTYRTTLLAGRDFTDADRATASPIAIVNEAFARRFLNGSNPIGRVLRQRAGAPPVEIIGLARDAVYRSTRDPLPPTVYLPLAQAGRSLPLPVATLSVRARADDPLLLTREIAQTVALINPQVRLTFTSLDRQVAAALTQERILAILSMFFGALALLLAAVGLYGVTSFGVQRRAAELGVRLTLGATPDGIVRLVLRRVMLLVASGVAVGTLGAIWLSRLIAALLFGVEARDPATLAAAALLLATIGTLAGWIPARRASRIEPVEILRQS